MLVFGGSLGARSINDAAVAACGAATPASACCTPRASATSAAAGALGAPYDLRGFIAGFGEALRPRPSSSPAPAARSDRDHMAVRIALSAAAPAKGSLTISYRTVSARWLPTYDAQFVTGEKGGAPSLAIVRRAEVVQATGEDWSNVRLTLSTAQVAGGTSPPELSPFLISLYNPDELRRRESTASGVMNDAVAAPAPTAKMLAEGDLGLAGQNAPAEYLQAAADFGDFRADSSCPARSRSKAASAPARCRSPPTS